MADTAQLPGVMSLSEVMREFDQHRSQGGAGTLEQFAAMRDTEEGGDRRKSAYKVGLLDRLNKFLGDASSAVARAPIMDPEALAAEASKGGLTTDIYNQQLQQYLSGGIPETSFAGMLGASMGAVAPAIGYPELKPEFTQIGQQAALETPRMLARTVSMPIGALDAAMQTGVQASEGGASTPSALTQAAISGGTFAAFPALAKTGSSVAGQVIAKGPMLPTAAERIGEFMGGTGLALAGTQVGSSAEQTVAKMGQGESIGEAATHASEEAYSPQNLAGQIAGLAPWVPKMAHEAMEVKRVGVKSTKTGIETEVEMPTLTQVSRFDNAAQAEDARQRFQQSMLQDNTAADDVAQKHPEVKALWKDYRQSFETDPDSPMLQEKMAKIQEVTRQKKAEALGQMGEPSEEKPKFSLTSPTNDIDFSGARSVQGNEVIDAIMENRLVPTGIPGNEKAQMLVQSLKQGLMPAGGRNFGREKELLRTGVMISKFGADGVDDQTSVAWQRMNSREKETAMQLAQIYENPKQALGLNPVQWSVNRPSPQERVEAGAKSVLASHDEPIGTPEQLGGLFKDVNSYVDEVHQLKDSLGLPEETRLQLEHNGPLVKYTDSEIQAIYTDELTRASLFPQGEALSRVIENAKSRVLAAKGLADRALSESDRLQLNVRQERAETDMKSDKEFIPRLEGLDKGVVKAIGDKYAKASEFSLDANNRRVSQLESFREKVGQALDSLSPEDRARLSTEVPQEAPKDRPSEAETQMSDRRYRQQVDDLLESTPAVYEKNGQKVKSNFKALLEGSHDIRSVEGTSERVEGRAFTEEGEQKDEFGTADLEETKEKLAEGEKEKADVGDAEVYKAVSGVEGKKTKWDTEAEKGGYNEDTFRNVVDNYFESTGEPMDAVITLEQMKDIDLQTLYENVFSHRALAHKDRTIEDTGYYKEIADGQVPRTADSVNRQAVTNFIRDVLRAELESKGQASSVRGKDGKPLPPITDSKKAIIEKFYGKPYPEIFKVGKVDWPTMRDKVISAEGAGSVSLAKIKALLSGYELKPGVDLKTVGAEYEKTARNAGKGRINDDPAKQFRFNLQDALTQEALRRGFSREWIASVVPSMAKMMKPFSAIQHASFAMLANPKQAFGETVGVMRALGLSVPSETKVGGANVQAPIIAADFGEILDKFGYADVAKYVMTTTIAHEALHTFVSEVVKHPEKSWPFHVKAQVRQYLNLLDGIHGMTDEDRSFLMQSAVDAMLPDSRTREVMANGTSKLRPEWQQYINAAVRNPEEFAAVLYSHAVAGLGREMVETKDAVKAAKNIQERMRWMDDDVREFVRGQFRDLADYAGTMQQVLDDPAFRIQQGYAKSVARIETHEAGEQKTAEDLPTGAPFEKVNPNKLSKVPNPRTEGTGLPTVGPKTAGQEATPVSELVAAAQGIAKAGEGGITHYKLLRALGKMDETLSKIQAQMSYFEAMREGPSSLEQAAQPGGIKTINFGDLTGEVKLSALAPGVREISPGVTTKTLGTAAGWLSGANASVDERFRQNVAMRYLSLMPQRLHYLAQQGLDVVRDASNSMNWQPTMHQLRDQAMSPFYPRGVDVAKMRDYWSFFFKGVEGETKVKMRQGFNDVVGKLQIASDPNDNSLTSSYAQSAIDRATKDLSPEDKATFNDVLEKHFAAYKNMMGQQLLVNENTQANSLGWLAMQMNTGKLKAAEAKMLGQQMLGFARLLEAGTGPQATMQQTIAANAAHQGLVQFAQMKGLVPETISHGLDIALDSVRVLEEQRGRMEGLGNFASEQRFGRHLVIWKDKADIAAIGDVAKTKAHTFGFNDDIEARHFAKKLAEDGHQMMRVEDTYKWSDAARLAQGLYGLDEFTDKLRGAFDKTMAKVRMISSPSDPTLGARVAQAFDESFNPLTELSKALTSSQLDKNMLKRQFKPGRELVDYVDNFHNYVQKTTTSLARQVSRSDLQLQTAELRGMGQEQLADDIMQHFHETITPELPAARIARQLIAGKALAVNLPNAMLEMLSPVQNGVWVLAREIGIKHAVTGYGTAVGRIGSYGMDKTTLDRIADAGQAKQIAGYAMTKEEDIAMAYRKLRDAGQFAGNPLTEDFEGDVRNVNISRPRMGELDWVDKAKVVGDQALNATLTVSKFLSKAREKATGWLRQGDAMAALEVGYRKGLRGDALHSYAASLIPVMSLIGNRSIRPLVATKFTQGGPLARNLFGSVYVMMNYEIGLTTQIMKDFTDSIGMSDLTPEQRSRARQAAGGALLANLAIAGAMGLPAVGSLMAIVQQATGADPEAAVREMLTSAGDSLGDMLGSDDATGARLTDIAMSGAINHYTGVDAASRAGVSSIFGFNEDTGFNLADLFGPTIGAMSDVGAAVKLTAQGQPIRALQRVAPTGIKPLLRVGSSLYNFGDVRVLDSNDNLVSKPDGVMQMGAMLMGLGAAKAGRMNREATLVRRGEDFAQKERFFEIEAYARQLLRGNTSDLIGHVYGKQFETDFNPKQFVESVIDKALDMQSPRDALESGALGTSRERAALGATFDTPRRSAMERLMAGEQLKSQLGYPLGMQPAGTREYTKASLVDQLMNTRGVTRQEALQIVQRQFGM